jgi:hypothetical protein
MEVLQHQVQLEEQVVVEVEHALLEQQVLEQVDQQVLVEMVVQEEI